MFNIELVPYTGIYAADVQFSPLLRTPAMPPNHPMVPRPVASRYSARLRGSVVDAPPMYQSEESLPLQQDSPYFPTIVSGSSRYQNGSEMRLNTRMAPSGQDTEFSRSSRRNPTEIPLPPRALGREPSENLFDAPDDESDISYDSSAGTDSDLDEACYEKKSAGHRGATALLADRRRLVNISSNDEVTPLKVLEPRTGLKRLDSFEDVLPHDEDYVEPEDTRATATNTVHGPMMFTADGGDDPAAMIDNLLKKTDYRTRRKEKARIVIEFNITSIVNRQNFLLKLARALMTFGAPSHRVESQLLACARILEVDAEFIHIPGIILCSFGDTDTKTSETHVVKTGGGLDLGNLHKVHQIYRCVVHDEICAKTANGQLSELLHAKPLYSRFVRLALAFTLSLLICPLAFGGSFVDMWVAGVGAVIISFIRLVWASESQLYANLFEITMAMVMSLAARALGSIEGDYFCYSAISSSAIVGILPGYLILRSSLELASKNIVCGSINMVYALFFTLCLGFSIQMGSDFYLILDRSARRDLETMSARAVSTIDIVGLFNITSATADAGNIPLGGDFTYARNTPYTEQFMFEGCFRPPTNPWFLRLLPSWTKYPIVPIFSILSSLENLQPWYSRELVVMVVISCASYFANMFANLYIFERSDIVSAIGAFVVGVLGNWYSRTMGGTAFTSMVTGVLFLVPSGLSQAGGMTVGNSVDIGGSMIAVTIGITVGLFMSQAAVYMFGTKKNAAVFSF